MIFYIINSFLIVILMVESNNDSPNCVDESGSCEFQTQITFGGNNNPATSVRSKVLNWGKLEPAKFSCGWRDGGAKKLDVYVQLDELSNMPSQNEVVQVYLASGVECDAYASPKPSGKLILMTVDGMNPINRKQGIKANSIETDPEISCVCLVLWCDSPRLLENDCFATVDIRFYDDFGIPSVNNKTLGMSFGDLITFVVILIETAMCGLLVVYCKTLVTGLPTVFLKC